jgi:hypothetical protein
MRYAHYDNKSSLDYYWGTAKPQAADIAGVLNPQ